jgi:hypothetical protein
VVRIGLLARAEDRGLGIQTWEWWRHMRPDATLVVDLAELTGGFPMHPGRYESAPVARWDGERFTDEAMVRDWLAGVDALYTAETLYDDRMAGWCAAAGVRAHVHINPELWRARRAERAAVVPWAPTAWRLDHLPPSTQVVPVPVPLDRWPVPAPQRANDEAAFLHVAGKRAAGDRNGTSLLLAALQRVSVPMRMRIITQDPRLPVPRCHPAVHVDLHVGGIEDYWRLYDDADVLVMPRRYGGLCLPVNEAAGAGLALVMSDVAPNHRWPIEAVQIESTTTMAVPAGEISTAAAHVGALTQTLTRLATDEALRHQRQRHARAWAQQMAWSMHVDEIREAMA